MDGESGPLKMWQIWALYDIAADFYADPENQAAFEAWQKQREKCMHSGGDFFGKQFQ